MKKKNFNKLLFDFLDGETSLEEERFLEKECQVNQELAKEKESYEKLISLFRQSDKISLPPGLTEKVMGRIGKKSPGWRQRIIPWIYWWG